jgi:single-stranded-DNA-specific exonuclease
MLRRIWEDVPCDVGPVRAIVTALGIPPVIARLLCQRGFDTPEAAERFLAPGLSQLHDPYALLDM